MLSAVAIRATTDCLNPWVKLRRFFLGTLVLLGEQCVLFPCLSSGVHSIMTVVLARRWAMVVAGRALSGRSLSGCVRSLPCAAGACSVVVRSAMVQELYQRSTPFVPITGRPGRICTRDGRGNDP